MSLGDETDWHDLRFSYFIMVYFIKYSYKSLPKVQINIKK